MIAARLFFAVAGLFGAAGVALMAAGTHAAGTQATIAGQMLLFHAPVIMMLALAERAGVLQAVLAKIAMCGLIAGAALFSGDLALRAFYAEKLFAFAAPLGGSVLLAGWLLAVLAAVLNPPRQKG